MPEVRLAELRIGFDYSVDINFPPGFLQADEGVRGALRAFPGGPAVATFADSRAGDTITWSLTSADTLDISPAEYISEAIIYDTLNPGVGEIPLTDNVYILAANFSPSEA